MPVGRHIEAGDSQVTRIGLCCAVRTKDLARVTVDTTVQPKDITFPTELLHAAIKGLTRLARKRGVRLRQSYVRIAKRAAIMAGRYAHAKQFSRDSPDESQTGINVRVFPALLQDRCEVLTATSTSGNPNAWSRV